MRDTVLGEPWLGGDAQVSFWGGGCWRLARTSVPAFNAYGGGVPLSVQSHRKCPPSAKKIPFAWGSKRYLAFGTDGWRRACLTYLLGERAARDRPRRARAIRVGREGGCVRGWWVGRWVVSGVAVAAYRQSPTRVCVRVIKRKHKGYNVDTKCTGRIQL